MFSWEWERHKKLAERWFPPKKKPRLVTVDKAEWLTDDIVVETLVSNQNRRM